MKVTGFVTGAYQENCWLVTDEASGTSVLIDPGAEGARLVEAVRQSATTLEAIWVTHAHFDHIGGIAAVCRTWPVPVKLHPADRPLYDRGEEIARHFGLPFEAPPAPDASLEDGASVTVGTLSFDVMHAPGHAPGHVVFHGHGVAFVGDCLFAGSVGRTDLPLSDGDALMRSLARIAQLPPDTAVYSGHGPGTTIGEELATNPFLMGLARPLRR